MAILGYFVVAVGIVLTLAGTGAGLWRAAEGARLGSRSAYQAEEAFHDESLDMEELQSDYTRGMGDQVGGLTEVAINVQAAVAPDVSLGSPGLSEGITFGSLAAQTYEDAQHDDDDEVDSSEDEADDGDANQDAEPAMFTGAIEVVLTGTEGNSGTGSVTIVVEDGGVVSGSVSNTWEDPGAANGPYRVTQSGAFSGSITVENKITASGTVRSVATDSDGTQTADMVITITATPDDESMQTWTVVMGPEGGEMSTLTGYVQ